MKIASHFPQAVQRQAATQPPANPGFKSDDDGPGIVDSVARAAVPVVGIGAGVTAAYYASKLFEAGSGGVMNAITGAVVGVVAGGATGFALDKVFGGKSDAAGNGMMAGMMVFGGAAVGGVTGVVSGAVGAAALATAPAAVLGTAAGLMGTAFVVDKLVGD